MHRTVYNPMSRKKAVPPPEQIKPERRPKGRPKRGGRIETRFSMVASLEYLEKLASLAKAMEKRDTADAVRQLIKVEAEKHGIKLPLI